MALTVRGQESVIQKQAKAFSEPSEIETKSRLKKNGTS